MVISMETEGEASKERGVHRVRVGCTSEDGECPTKHTEKRISKGQSRIYSDTRNRRRRGSV